MWPTVALLLLSLVAVSGASGYDTRSATSEDVPSFGVFAATFGRDAWHDPAERVRRAGIYAARAEEALRHNANPARSWTAGVSEYFDWTDEELTSLRGWRRHARPEESGLSLVANGAPAKDLPEEVSWVHLNSTASIPNQGMCGSCWALAAATVLTAHNEIYNEQHPNRKFSAQELVSCVKNPHHCGGTGGCEGATTELAFEHVLQHGLATEEDVPYKADDTKCTQDLKKTHHHGSHKKRKHSHETQGSYLLQLKTNLEANVRPAMHTALSFGMHGWEKLPENQYEPLMRAVVERGPVAVAVAADGWMMYKRGIFDTCKADAVIDHAVTLVGYGADKKEHKKFWNIQNSWGPRWGESGRLRLLRRDDDEKQCGIDRKPEVGSGCDGGPKQVTVCGMCGVLYDTVVPIFDKVPARGAAVQVL